MRKLQVLTADGSWAWVFGSRQPGGTLSTTPQKSQALPPSPVWAEDDLAWAKKTWPERSFRLAQEL